MNQDKTTEQATEETMLPLITPTQYKLLSTKTKKSYIWIVDKGYGPDWHCTICPGSDENSDRPKLLILKPIANWAGMDRKYIAVLTHLSATIEEQKAEIERYRVEITSLHKALVGVKLSGFMHVDDSGKK